MTVATEVTEGAVVVRRWVIWRCDSCRRCVPHGVLYLLSDHRSWHVRHAVLCVPRDHEVATILKIPVSRIQWTDQFDWWMTLIEARRILTPPAIRALLAFLRRHASFPPEWSPRRVDLTAPAPVGVL